MEKKLVTIRKEKFGYLVYSTMCYSYLLPNEQGEKVIGKVISNVESRLTNIFAGVKSEYVSELIHIGMGRGVRIVDNRYDIRRDLFAPLEYYFDYTNKCNLGCPNCYNQNHLGSITMSKEDVTRIISEMYDLGIMRLHLAGGEPTIEKEGIKNYLSTADRYGIITSMATNGTLINDEMCEILMESNLYAISVSIDGWNEDTNKIRRGSDFFSKSHDGLKRLISYRNKNNKSTELCIKPIFTYETEKDYFEKMVEMAIEIGADKIKFSNPERSLHHERGHYGCDANKYYLNMECISQLQAKYKNVIKITNINNPYVGCMNIGLPNMRGCIGAQELLTINPDGRITPCLMNDTLLGNYYQYNSMEDFLLNSNELKEYLLKIDHEDCHNCKIYHLCRGGCQVRKIVEYGEINNYDPLCPIANKKKDREFSYNKYILFKEICVSHSL